MGLHFLGLNNTVFAVHNLVSACNIKAHVFLHMVNILYCIKCYVK